MDFTTLSSKKKILLRHANKLYTKTLFAIDERNRIIKNYWSCINKECPGRVNYEVDVEAAMNDGMSNIGLTFLTPHDNEVCRTDEIEVVQRVARSEILSRATQGTELVDIKQLILRAIFNRNLLL